MFDQASELYHNPEVRTLFKKYGYDVYCTSPESSFSNGQVERAHRTVADSIRALLISSGLPVKFWNFAFFHTLRIGNAIPHAKQIASPLMMATGKKDNLKNLRTFGCRVIISRLGKPRGRFSKNKKPIKGIFLGYSPHSTRLILWWDPARQRVGITSHCTFDEGYSDLAIDELPPGASQLVQMNHRIRIPEEEDAIKESDLRFYIYPFANTQDVTCSVPPNKSPMSGLEFADDKFLKRTYLYKAKDHSCIAKSMSKGKLKKLRGSFITHINGRRVFDTKTAV